MGWLLVILIGGVAGWLGSTIMGAQGNGFIFNIFLGIVGGLVGSWLFTLLNVSTAPSLLGFLVTATVGSIVLIFLGRIITGRS